MTDDELVERMAEALWQAESERAAGRRRLIPWEEEGADMQNWWRIGARAALAVAEPVIRERCAVKLETMARDHNTRLIGTSHTPDHACALREGADSIRTGATP